MNKSLPRMAAGLGQAALAFITSLLPYVAQIQPVSAHVKPPMPDCGCSSREVSALAPKADGAAAAIIPKKIFLMMPGKVLSKNSMAVLHDSGEVAVIPDDKIDKNGKLGKFKRVYGFWSNSATPVEIKVAAKGAKVTMKVPGGNTVSASLNKTTGLALVKIKGKLNGFKFANSATVPISDHGNFWFETSDKLLLYSKTWAAMRFRADYSAFSAPGAVPRGAGATVLGAAEGAVMSNYGWLMTKLAAIATGIVSGAIGNMPGSAPATAFASIIGFGSAITGFYNAVKFNDPAAHADISGGVFGVITTDDLETYGAYINKILDFLLRGSNLLNAGTIWGLLTDVMNELLEKPSHSLANGIVLKILYTWPPDQFDLDTSTTFLGQSVGYACGSTAAYLDWTGDDTGTGGMEQVTCLISDAAVDLVLPANFDISAKAGWYTPAGGSGPATLEMYLQNPETGTLYGPRRQLTINPGTQSGCAATPVGSASFVWDAATTRLTWTFD
jgi:hypothetical protein